MSLTESQIAKLRDWAERQDDPGSWCELAKRDCQWPEVSDDIKTVISKLLAEREELLGLVETLLSEKEGKQA